MNIIKKLVILAALAVVALPVFAAGSPDAGAKLAQVKKAGKLVMGTSADYPPYEFHHLKDGKDSIVGFDVAIAREIAADLGVKLEIKDMQFDGLLAALQAGTIDIVIAGMTPTEERKQSVDFSTTYYYAIHGVMVRGEDKNKFADVASLKGARLSAQKGTIQVDIAKKQILGMTDEEAEKDTNAVKELGTIKNLVLDLKNGKVDAIVAELPVAMAYVGKNADLAIAAPTFQDDTGGSAVAVKKGNENLVTAINGSLARLMEAKKIEQFVADANEMVEN